MAGIKKHVYFQHIRIILITIFLLMVPILSSSTSAKIVEIREPKLHLYPSNSNIIDSNEIIDPLPLTRGKILKWKYETTEGSYISTPALVDLNGDGTLEIVFTSDADAVYALSSSGDLLWRNKNYTISRADEFMTTPNYYYLPLFSSITPADILGDNDTELLFGAKNFVVCLDSNGEELWKTGETDRYFISTPAVTNLESDIYVNKSYQEIIVLKDNTNQDSWPEVISATGQLIYTLQKPVNFQNFGFASIAVMDLDGSNIPDTWKDLIFGNRYSPLRLYSFDGQGYSREISQSETNSCMVYGTGAVGDFTGDGELEYFIGSYEPISGATFPLTNSRGWYYLYDPINETSSAEVEHRLLRRALPNTPNGILSSPAVGDVHCGKSNPKTGKINYEAFITSHNGRVYCVDLSSGDILWSYNTGNSITSSPALCNIGLNDSLEVIVCSNNGKIFCLDGDPSDGVDEGVSDSGGSNYDIIWEFNTGSNGTWVSSPVVADIDNDKELEVVVGDKDGTIWCLNAGSTPNPGQQDWPMFQHDTRNTGVYTTRMKNFKVTLEIPNGDGQDLRTCYAKNKPYTFRVELKDYMGFDDLKNVVISIDPEGYNIKLKWSQQTNTFKELNDEKDLVKLYTKRSEAFSDNQLSWTLNFQIMFNWTFEKESPISIGVECEGYANPAYSKYFKKYANVENDIEFFGNIEVIGQFQGELQYGDWVKGSEEVIWSNLSIIYNDSVMVYPDNKEFSVFLMDKNGKVIYQNLSTRDEEISFINMLPDVTDLGFKYTLGISGIPKEALGEGAEIEYLLKIDNTPPQPPAELLLHADSYNDPQSNADNDTEIYAIWTGSNEELSGIKGYYYNTTNQGGTNFGYFTSDTKAIIDTGSYGSYDIFVWAIDNVGNSGNAIHSKIIIDSQELEYSILQYDKWHNTSTILFEATVNDLGGSGLDPNSIQYSIQLHSETEFGPWLPFNQNEDFEWLDDSHTIVNISKLITFNEDGINYIYLRAKDLAGNGFSFSDYIRVMIDTTQPAFINPGSVNINKNDPRIIKCNITIKDHEGSGINTTEIWYKYSTSGINGYSDWQQLNIGENPNALELNIDVTLNLDYGKNNYILWRATDIAKNGYVESDNILVKVNSLPIIMIRSPVDFSKLRYYHEELIEFDARESYDPDEGDILTYFWKTKIQLRIGQEKEYGIGTSDHFTFKLQPGYNNVTLYLDDGFSNVSKNVNVFVYDKNTDTDDDGLPDWWEEKFYGLDPEDSSDAQKDLDGDGTSNFDEFIKGTNPANPSEYPGAKKTTKKEKSDYSTFYIMLYVILIVIIVIFLVSLYFVKQIKIKKSREDRLKSTTTIVVRRDSIDSGLAEKIAPKTTLQQLPEQTKPGELGRIKDDMYQPDQEDPGSVPDTMREPIPKLPSFQSPQQQMETSSISPTSIQESAPQPGMSRKPVESNFGQTINQTQITHENTGSLNNMPKKAQDNQDTAKEGENL